MSSKRIQEKSINVKVSSNGRNISAVWRSKKSVSKESSKNTEEKCLEVPTHSFTLKKKEKPSGIQLKVDIKKYESAPRYISEERQSSKFRKKTMNSYDFTHHQIKSEANTYLEKQIMMN